MENSSSMQRGIAPPQGLEVDGLRSKRKVSMPAEARASAAEDPAGPPPITAARSFRPEMGALEEVMVRERGFEGSFALLVVRLQEEMKERSWWWVWADIILMEF